MVSLLTVKRKKIKVQVISLVMTTMLVLVSLTSLMFRVPAGAAGRWNMWRRNNEIGMMRNNTDSPKITRICPMSLFYSNISRTRPAYCLVLST